MRIASTGVRRRENHQDLVVMKIGIFLMSNSPGFDLISHIEFETICDISQVNWYQ